MARKTQTPLAYVMELLGMSGKKLAEAVHLHQSMISKWKNGAMELTPKSRYFDEIMRALLEEDARSDKNELEHFLCSVLNGEVSESNTLEDMLLAWLTGESFRSLGAKAGKNCLYEARHSVYKGIMGKKHALDYFLNTLFMQEVPAEAWGYEYNPEEYYTTSPIARSIQNKFLKLADRGNRFNLMIFLNRPIEQIFGILKFWLPVCAATGAQIYFSHGSLPLALDSLYYMEGKIAIIGSRSKKDAANLYSGIFEDYFTLEHVQYYLESMQEGFSPLLKYLNLRDVHSDIGDVSISKKLKRPAGQYAFMSAATGFIMGGRHVSEALLNAAITDAEVAALERFQKQGQKSAKRFFSSGKTSRILIQDNMMNEISGKEYMEFPLLNAYMGRRVRVPVKSFARDMIGFLTRIKSMPDVETGLLPEQVQNYIPGMNAWIKEDSFAYFQPIATSARIVVEEFASVHALYNMAERLWDSLPLECKTPELLVKRFENML